MALYSIQPAGTTTSVIGTSALDQSVSRTIVPIVIPFPPNGVDTVTIYTTVACQLPGSGHGITFGGGEGGTSVTVHFGGSSNYYYIYNGASSYSIYGPDSITNLAVGTSITASYSSVGGANPRNIGGVTLIPQALS